MEGVNDCTIFDGFSESAGKLRSLETAPVIRTARSRFVKCK